MNNSQNKRLTNLFDTVSEMRSLIEEHDWSQTPLGNIDTWSPGLQTAVKICIFSRYPIFIWWGADYIKIYNDAYRPILGTKHPDALGQRGREIWAEIWHIIGPMADGVFQSGQATWSYDLMLPMERHGYIEETYFSFSYSPIVEESGTIGGIFGAVTETTGRVLSERRLRTLRDLGRQTSEAKTAEDACHIAAQVLYQNPADVPFALLYLLEGSPVTWNLVGSSGTTAVPTVHPGVVARVLAGHTVVIERLETWFDEQPAGIWTEPPDTAIIVPVTGSSQQVIGFFIAGVSPRLALNDEYHDFFELVGSHISTAVNNARAYEEERKRAEALAELDRTKTEFFSNVSHEFRTPLTLMLSPLQHLLDTDLAPDQRESLKLIHRNGLRLLKLVNSLLDFSRIQYNRIHAAFEPVDLAELTTDLASSFRSLIEHAGMRLVVDCPPLSEPVYVDREMWEKVVLNLLSNAFKFTFEGEITVSLRDEGDRACLTVRDTGIGIYEHELPLIFDRFHRVKGARSRTYEGSGIGLALVRELIHLMGGEIHAVSEVNAGTTFMITLPFGTTHLPQLGDEYKLPSTATGAAPYIEEALRWLSDDEAPKIVSDIHVLVVDDNADMRGYLRRLLQDRYTVHTAENGQQALDIIGHHPLNLMVTDVMMPYIDGFELLRRVRANPATQTLPVILVSARAGDEARREGLQHGADDYLVKPFTARELLTRIESTLEIARLRRQELETRIQSEQRIRRIHEITTPLSEAITPQQVATVIIDKTLPVLGSHHGTLGILRGDRLELLRSVGVSDDVFELYRFTSLNALSPMTEAIHSRHPLWFETQEAYIERYPHYAHVIRTVTHTQSAAALPLIVSGQIIGALVISFPKPYQLSQDTRAFLITLADHCAQALERARLFEAESIARQEAQEANELKMKFLGMISHELRTPLTSIKGFATTLLADDVKFDEPTQRYFLDIVNQEANKLTMLVDQLLDMARLKAGTLAIYPEPHPIQSIIDNATGQLTMLLVKHRLEISLPEPMPVVAADSQRISQVLVNLVGNAVKFSPAGSLISIRVVVREGVATLSVTDEGSGIAPEQREIIFEPFRQVDIRKQRPNNGAGLGLAICKGIIESHGGRIWVEDSSGKGTTISFTLPIV